MKRASQLWVDVLRARRNHGHDGRHRVAVRGVADHRGGRRLRRRRRRHRRRADESVAARETPSPAVVPSEGRRGEGERDVFEKLDAGLVARNRRTNERVFS